MLSIERAARFIESVVNCEFGVMCKFSHNFSIGIFYVRLHYSYGAGVSEGQRSILTLLNPQPSIEVTSSYDVRSTAGAGH